MKMEEPEVVKQVKEHPRTTSSRLKYSHQNKHRNVLCTLYGKYTKATSYGKQGKFLKHKTIHKQGNLPNIKDTRCEITQ